MRTAPVANSGFTLLEMMLVITIAAVILGLGVPNMRQFILNNRMTGAANDLLTAVHIARTESIKRHAQTVMCFSSDPARAQPPCDGNGTQGWVVFVDDIDPTVTAATDNNGQADAGEAVLLRHGAIAAGITANSLPAGNKGYVAYSPAGFSRQIAAVGTRIDSLRLCDNRGNTAIYGNANSAARGFVISPTGRPSITRVVSEIATLGGC
jgi:type IV fimbrial biogenesis protein FimT